MRRRCTGLLPVVAGVAAVLTATGCKGASSQVASASASPGLLNGAVTLAAGRALTSGEQRQVRSVLQARLAALHIDAIVSMVGDRAVRLQVPEPTEQVVRQLGAAGRFEVRPVETSGPKGKLPGSPPGSVPAPVARSAGSCHVTAPGDTQGWLAACDPAQDESYLLWPAELTNSDVASASELPSRRTGDWQVTISFTSTGQRRFFLLTQRSVGMQLALVVDGVVRSAPLILKAIDGDAQLAADLDQPHALLLATLVGNGALPVALRPQAG
jgi:preprotein translocase subunit SecD